jgi:hypothetical protein
MKPKRCSQVTPEAPAHPCLLQQQNEIWSLAGKWMGLENINLSDVSQAQKAKGLHVFSHMWNTDPMQMQQYYEKQVTLMGCHLQGGGGERRKLGRWIWLMYFLFKNEYGIFFFCSTGAWTQGLHLESLHQPFLCIYLIFFWQWILWTIYLGWLQTWILLISASWVARITGVGYQCPAEYKILNRLKSP